MARAKRVIEGWDAAWFPVEERLAHYVHQNGPMAYTRQQAERQWGKGVCRRRITITVEDVQPQARKAKR